MLWNPFQHQFTATYLFDEGELAVLEIRKGAALEQVRFPKILLPPALAIGSSFNLKLEDSETARTGEIQTMQRLLSDLLQ
ncbi:MAG: hypothetical protein AAB383_00530 [Patescibacteria group bacterium]